MEFSKIATIDIARELIEKNFSSIKPTTEIIDVMDSVNRITGKSYYSNENLPTFNRSTVDGYAINSHETMGVSKNSPISLKIAGMVKMGKTFDETLKPNEAIYVPTGGMVPDGSDGVIMIEDTEVFNENELKIYSPISKNENMIFIGDDLKKDEIVIQKGKKITPLDIGVLCVAGITKIEVYKPLSFSIISTGDEIIEIDKKQNKGEIRDINSHILHGLLQESGCIVVKKTIVGDDFEKIKSVVASSLAVSDAVIMTGGSSVGNLDYTYEVLNSFNESEVLVHGLKVKPGKPTIISKTMNKPVFALPGHPVSAVVIYKLLIEYFLDIITGSEICENSIVMAKISKDIQSQSGKMTCQVVRLEYHQNEIIAHPVYGKSGVISLLSKSNGYVKIPIDEGIKKDNIVRVNLL